MFAWNLARAYYPGQAFTYFIEFGSRNHARYLPEVRAVNHFEMPDSAGYDAQWYAQIAAHPRLADPALDRAVDGLRYRARRILFPGLAWLLAGGDPVGAIDVYSVENVVAWVLLAVLLFRWLPPTSWDHCARWAAVLLSFGLVFSVERALPDGPSLLVIAAAAALAERGRPWLAAGVLAIGGLGKDTNVLAASGLGDGPERRRRWAVQAALVVLPLALWTACLRLWLGPGPAAGERNFAGPFVGLAHKIAEILSRLPAQGHEGLVARYDACVMAGLLAQLLFFGLRWRPDDRWWRIGASYAVLAVFLGNAVWEDYPSAAARVLLPMTLAFNLRVPKGAAWALLLVAGNLGILASADIARPPTRESYRVVGPRALRINPVDRSVVEAVYGPENWWLPERSLREFSRWNAGTATVTLRNPQPFAIAAQVSFKLLSPGRRAVSVSLGAREVWEGDLRAAVVTPVTLAPFELPPGDTVLTFRTDRPAAYPANGDQRRVTFKLKDLQIDLLGRK